MNIRSGTIASLLNSPVYNLRAFFVDEVPPVLIVDDETMILLFVADALSEAGYTVLEASDAAAAMAHIDERENLRGLVTDIRLGSGEKGWAVAHHARQKFPNLPVVYITGDSADDWSADGVPQSAVLQKPFLSAELVAALTHLLVMHHPSPSNL